jgi:hypothetical protein
MNIAVIGKGTSSIITTLVLLKKGHNVTIFYDPQTPHINVGESTTPLFANLVYESLGLSIHKLVDLGIFSYKMGINFVNWGCGNTFHNNFPGSNIANHFETKPFNKFIHDYLESNNIVKYVPERVDEYSLTNNIVILNGRSFDFVVNCAGWEHDENYIDPIFETVNSAILFVDELEYTNTHTLHLATEDGWQFGLPFPQKNIFKCGYLYNNNYTSEEDACKKISREIYEKFSWKPRYSKELIKNPWVALNGNRLFFFEPLQALSLHYTITFAEFIASYLDEPTQDNFNRINYDYHYEIWQYQLSLAYHYQFGSIHETEFWKDKKTKALEIMKHNLNGNFKIFESHLNYDMYNQSKRTFYSRIGCFASEDHNHVYYGMTGKPFD